MSPDAPLRAWLALGAVIAVGATALVIRPAAAPPRASAGAVATTPVLEARPLSVGGLAPPVRAAVPAPWREPAGHGSRRAMAVTVAAHGPVPGEAAGGSAAEEPTARGPVAVAEAPPLPETSPLAGRALEPSGLPAAITARTAATAGPGWGPRAGLAMAGGLRAAGDGIRTGFEAAAGAMRRHD